MEEIIKQQTSEDPKLKAKLPAALSSMFPSGVLEDSAIQVGLSVDLRSLVVGTIFIICQITDHLPCFLFILDHNEVLYTVSVYKNQRAYLAIPISDIKGLMILKNVLPCFKPSYCSVHISPWFL